VPNEGSGGAITIENGTALAVSVYFRGPAERSVIVHSGQTLSVGLPAGRYQVAAEIPGSSVIPFYGEQTYDPNNQYRHRFYLGKLPDR
jgi:hypothetical protein